MAACRGFMLLNPVFDCAVWEAFILDSLVWKQEKVLSSWRCRGGMAYIVKTVSPPSLCASPRLCVLGQCCWKVDTLVERSKVLRNGSCSHHHTLLQNLCAAAPHETVSSSLQPGLLWQQYFYTAVGFILEPVSLISVGRNWQEHFQERTIDTVSGDQPTSPCLLWLRIPKLCNPSVGSRGAHPSTAERKQAWGAFGQEGFWGAGEVRC